MRNHYPRQISKISKTNNDRLRESNVSPEMMPKHAWKYCKLTKLRCAIISQSFLEKKRQTKKKLQYLADTLGRKNNLGTHLKNKHSLRN